MLICKSKIKTELYLRNHEKGTSTCEFLEKKID